MKIQNYLSLRSQMSGGESDVIKKYFSVKAILYCWGPSSHQHLWKSDTTWMLSFPRDGTAYAKIKSFVKNILHCLIFLNPQMSKSFQMYLWNFSEIYYLHSIRTTGSVYQLYYLISKLLFFFFPLLYPKYL